MCFLPVAPLQSGKKSAHIKNSGDSPESNQVKINQVLCCILTISRFYIGQADVTVNLGGSQISMPKNRCHILSVHPSVEQVCGLQLHNQHILYQICRLFIYPPRMASITCCIMPALISISSTSKNFLANPLMICYHKKGESHRSGSTLKIKSNYFTVWPSLFAVVAAIFCPERLCSTIQSGQQ